MKAVFINHCHPDVPHVCGLRAGRFADALAARGHQIVVLCQVLPKHDTGFPMEELGGALENHDWRKPFVLPCLPAGFETITRARHGQLMSGWRHMVIAWSYAKHGGMFPDWQAGVTSYFPLLAEHFRPEVVWGTFGNTDTWQLCQQLARQSGCPWVGDFKDNWGAFVPSGLHTMVAARFTDASQMTVYSCAHCDQADVLFPQTMKTVVYSGVEAVADVPPAESAGPFTLTLTGSIYDPATLERMMAALGAWVSANAEREVVLHYAGNDADAVRVAASEQPFDVQLEGFMVQDALHELQSRSHANLYVHNPVCLMHHKSLELIAMGRPVISFPGETREVTELAAEAGGSLFACADADQLAEALDVIASNPSPVPNKSRREGFTWAARAGVLEKVLHDVIAGGRS